MTAGAVPERFNPAALDMLRRLGNGTLLVRMVELFLQTIPERIASARAGLQMNDVRAVEIAAHSIKSSAGQLGGVGLQHTAALLEHAASNGNVDTLAAGIETIDTEFELMRVWLNQVTDGMGAAST